MCDRLSRMFCRSTGSLIMIKGSPALCRGLQVRGMAKAVDKITLSKLRKQTGISFIKCKNALEQFENDFKKAEKWLMEQAQKEGWAKATKLQSRNMSYGLVAVVSNQQAATMIEVNCETDFVARNHKFISLTKKLAQNCHQALLQMPQSSLELDKAAGLLVAADGKSLADHVALEVGNIGENMLLRRAVQIKNNSSYLSSYVHVSGPEISTDSDCCHLGKYGVILSLSQTAAPCKHGEELSLEEISLQLGQHIVGMNPMTVGNFDEMVESEEEENRLVFQEFLLNPSISVGKLLKRNNVEVNTFYRFACGEELQQEGKGN